MVGALGVYVVMKRWKVFNHNLVANNVLVLRKPFEVVVPSKVTLYLYLHSYIRS